MARIVLQLLTHCIITNGTLHYYRENLRSMRRVFGKKKASAPAPSLEQASGGLGGRIDEIDKKINSLESELRGYKDKIKKTKSPAAKKQLQKRALDILKRKRMYEQQRDQIAGQQFNVDQANFGIESAKANVETVAAMKQANKELKSVMKNDLDIDVVDDLADDMAELMDDFNEINEALGYVFFSGAGYLLMSVSYLIIFLSSLLGATTRHRMILTRLTWTRNWKCWVTNWRKSWRKKQKQMLLPVTFCRPSQQPLLARRKPPRRMNLVFHRLRLETIRL